MAYAITDGIIIEKNLRSLEIYEKMIGGRLATKAIPVLV
jgi:hypothetical protein